ncbi:MAG: GAF domain-containing protein [Anaerolineales bacterium]
MDPVRRILFITEDGTDSQNLREFIKGEDFQVEIDHVESYRTANEYLSSKSVDMIIADYQIGQEPIFDHLDYYNDYPWVVLTAHGSENIAAQSLKSGAVDYIVKDSEGSYLPLLVGALKNAVLVWEEKKREEEYRQELEEIVSQKTDTLEESKQKLAQESLQRARAVERLKESREIYRRIFQTSRDAVFIASSQGHWIDMNQSALEMFGYQGREEIWQDSMLDLFFDPEDGLAYRKIVEEKGSVKDRPVSFRKKDGSRIETLVSATPYEVGGQIIGYQGFIRDITGELAVRQQQEKTLQQQSALDELSRALTSCLTPEDIYRNILVQIRKLFQLSELHIYKLPSLDDGFQIEYSWRKDGKNQGSGFTGVELSNPKVSFLNDLLDSDQGLCFPDLSALKPPAAAGSGSEQITLAGSMLVTPLMVEDQVIAALQLLHPDVSAYGDEELLLQSRIANLVGIGLQKAYLYQETQAQVDKLTSLQRIEETVLENLSLPTTLDMLIDQMVKELSVDAAAILYFHPQLKTLKFITQTGFRQNILQHTDLEIGEGLAGKAAESRTMVRVPDLKQTSQAISRDLEFSTEKFVSYFGVPLTSKGRLVGVLELYHRKRLDPDQSWIDLLEMIAGLAAIAIDFQNVHKNLECSRNELDRALDAIIEGWAQALELRGIESPGHWRRIEELSLALGQKLRIKSKLMSDLRRGALLHDIGKMAIPDEVLHKRTALSVEERKLIGKHPVAAHDLLKDVEGLKSALDVPLYHHERWDGTGYPYQLEGENIPYLARIFAVVDVWDAMRSDRPYRKAIPKEKALKILKEEAGKQFDPEIVQAFLVLIEERMPDQIKADPSLKFHPAET